MMNNNLDISNEEKFRGFLETLIQIKGENKGKPYAKSTVKKFIARLNNLEEDIFSINSQQSISKIIDSVDNISVPYSTKTGLRHYLNFLKSDIN